LLATFLLTVGSGCVRQIPSEAISPERLPPSPADSGASGLEQVAGSTDAQETGLAAPATDASDMAVETPPGPQMSPVDIDGGTASHDAAVPTGRADAGADQAASIDVMPSPFDVGLNPPTRPADLTRDRVGHWRLDEQGGTAAADSGPIGNHGATIGLADEDWKPARLRNGLAFKPQQRSFVLVGAHATLSPTRALSIALWVNARSWQGQPCLLEKGDAVDEYGLGAHAGQLQFLVRLREGKTVRASAPLPALNDWVHVAAIYDGQAAFLFVRGQLVGATPAPGHPWTANNDLTIGGRRRANVDEDRGDFFAGMLDEVLLYARALSAEEVALLAAGKSP
jgi:hypothetical protein